MIQSNSSDNCLHRYNIEILKLFDPELQLINTKPLIKKKIKRISKRDEKLQRILVLEYKKRNNSKILHSNAKPIASDSDITEAIKPMH